VAGPQGDFPRPRLVVSRCLGFEPVRYNGQVVRDDFVQRLAAACDVVAVCPEVDIGLGVPRPPVRLVRELGDQTRLIQPETGRDLTATMRDFGTRFLDRMGGTDGFILKSRSPSCGFRDAKVFPSIDAKLHETKRAGAFASLVADRLATSAALEDEERLGEAALRDRFLSLLYALARLRAVEASGERSELVGFHARHKFLLLAYDERGMRDLGGVVARVAEWPWTDGVARYRLRLAAALARPAAVGGHVNALQHAFGLISEACGPAERAAFLLQIEEVRAGRAPLAQALATLREGAGRYGNPYLAAQAYLEPYPPDLA
jgi:uncharacterized protein YbgA (DUF1722 family)/uncharacterized protein YbbK (DUF523 family)